MVPLAFFHNALLYVTPATAAAVACAVALVAVVGLSTRWASPCPCLSHSLDVVKQPRRLALSPAVALRLLRLLRHPEDIPELVLRAALAFGEQPWLRSFPLLPDVLMVSSPTLVEDVVKTKRAHFVKSRLFREITEETLGDAFFTQEGLAWLHQRKIASRFFAPRVYRDVATATIQRHAAKLFAVLGDARTSREPVDLTRLLHAFTFQAFADLGFGLKTHALDARSEPHELERAIDAAFSQTIYRVLMPPWLWKLQRWLGIGSERAYAQHTTEIRRVVQKLVQESIALLTTKPPDEPANLVELFIAAMRDGELPFSPQLLCDLAVMFLLAGRDTTAGTLNWILFALHQHPHVERKIRDELWEKVPRFMEGGDGDATLLSMEDAHALTYLEAAIKETMRLYPIVPLTLRTAEEDAVLVDGTFVKRGTIIGMSPYVMGRLPSLWGDDALEFKPERFLDEPTGKLKTVSAFQFFGFLAGPRICIGMNLAMLEMKLVLAGLLRRFQLEVAPNDGSYKMSALMPLKHPLVARVHAAAAPAAAREQ